MKTKDFIKKANELGYNVKKVGLGTKVSGKINCCTVALINEDFYNMVDLSYVHYMDDDLFDLIVSYAKTPVEERKSVKKYSVKVLPYSDGYLNVRYGCDNIVTNRYIISDTKELAYCKTKFTEDEIEELKKQPDLAIDWDKVWLESVE